MAKQEQNSIVEPTEEELVIYKQLIKDIPEEQMDELANNYFEKISEKNLNISFARFLINKMIRPIQPGDTINFQTEDGKMVFLFCLIRKEIENVNYLLFAEADSETEELKTDFTYLFYVDGYDEIGTEIIDIMPNGNETERILDLMEADFDVETIKNEILGEEKQE